MFSLEIFQKKLAQFQENLTHNFQNERVFRVILKYFTNLVISNFSMEHLLQSVFNFIERHIVHNSLKMFHQIYFFYDIRITRRNTPQHLNIDKNNFFQRTLCSHCELVLSSNLYP